jgi:hypothetical protein
LFCYWIPGKDFGCPPRRDDAAGRLIGSRQGDDSTLGMRCQRDMHRCALSRNRDDCLTPTDFFMLSLSSGVLHATVQIILLARPTPLPYRARPLSMSTAGHRGADDIENAAAPPPPSAVSAASMTLRTSPQDSRGCGIQTGTCLRRLRQNTLPRPANTFS